MLISQPDYQNMIEWSWGGRRWRWWRKSWDYYEDHDDVAQTRSSEHPQSPKAEPKGSLVNDNVLGGLATTCLCICHHSVHNNYQQKNIMIIITIIMSSHLMATSITTLSFLQADRFFLHKRFLVPFKSFIYFRQRHLNIEDCGFMMTTDLIARQDGFIFV